MAKTSSSLTWSDRLALIKHYAPSDSTICSALGVSQDELITAREMEAQGAFVATTDLDIESYAGIFASNSADKVTESIIRPTDSGKPAVTATKKVPTARKRGRKGDNIKRAYAAIPSTPVQLETFANEHQVAVHVLTQCKRFDSPDSIGTVHVKTDKATKQLMIWREV